MHDVHTEPMVELVELDREERFRLLKATRLGRLAVNVPGWPPVIRPVNHAFDESSKSVVFRSGRGSKFTALLLSGHAAFEIAGIEPAARTGGVWWSTARQRRSRPAQKSASSVASSSPSRTMSISLEKRKPSAS
jgi:Pyridoxamine 5'-phosphate oxidase